LCLSQTRKGRVKLFTISAFLPLRGSQSCSEGTWVWSMKMKLKARSLESQTLKTLSILSSQTYNKTLLISWVTLKII
jgi:hypothetical protein